MNHEQQFDAIIIGGSYAGLSAALALGRAIRNVLVIDHGKPCNSQTPHSHNFLTQDGSTPAAIVEKAKAQVLAYPTIQFLTDQVVSVQGTNNQYLATTLSGKTLPAKKLLFATGVKDVMPNIPGFAECWGISIIHCPYCHGYEYRGQATGILANGDMAVDFGKFIRNWTDQLTIYTNGPSTISVAQQEQLFAAGISVVEKPLKAVNHKQGYLSELVFMDDERQPLTALYAKIPFEQHCNIPRELGCNFNDAGYLLTDEFQKTSVPGIYAAGDNVTLFRSVASAVAAGTLAGAMMNREVVAETIYHR